MQLTIVPATPARRPSDLRLDRLRRGRLHGRPGDPGGAACSSATRRRRSIGLPPGWIEGTPFGSYLVPGLYLFAMNGIGMLVLAALIVLRHWSAPWLTAILGVGLIIWILVQLAVMPETMILQWIFLATGLVLGFVALFWLRRTGQLRLW